MSGCGNESNDIVCRYGGDEFIILIELDEEKTAVKKVSNFQKVLDEYNLKQLKPYSLSVSFGYSCSKYSAQKSFQDIMCEADDMMYKKKAKCKSGGETQLMIE